MQSVTNPGRLITKIPQLRISLTVPCGKKCVYCRPGGEGFDAPRESEMTVHHVVELSRIFVRNGVTDIKLTGGDPMLRPDIVEIVRELRAIDGVRSIHMVTRHHRAGSLAGALKNAGLDVLNFSVDSLDPHTWSAITGVKGHHLLIEAVRQAAATGITVKLNAVILSGVNSDEIPALVDFAGEFGAELKLLDLIDDVPGFSQTVTPPGFSRDRSFNLDTVLDRFRDEASYADLDTQPGGLGHPMPRFGMPSGATVLVKTANEGAWYGGICEGCRFFPCHDALMAVRLTAAGELQHCLLRDDNLVDVRSMIDAGRADDAELAIRSALDVYASARFFDRRELADLRKRRTIIPLALSVKPSPANPSSPASIDSVNS
ncbi:MAG TPA: radical SAM protein [Streptosporangiaceae bacterium]